MRTIQTADGAKQLEASYTNAVNTNVNILIKLMAQDLQSAIPSSKNVGETVNKRITVLNALLSYPNQVGEFANKAKSIFGDIQKLVQMVETEGKKAIAEGQQMAQSVLQ